MNATAATGSWGMRLSHASFWMALGAVALALGGAIGAGQDWWDKLLGLGMLRYAVFIAIAALLLALAALVTHMRKRTGRIALIAGALILSLGYLGYIGQQIMIVRSVPMIHDVTTSPDDPPAFQTLTLRADNLAVVPDGDNADLAKLSPIDRWEVLHRASYGDIAPILVPGSVAATVSRIEALAKARGWVIAVADPATGRVEATDSVALFKFKDDVVFRVRPDPAGAEASRVEMRSVSRLGVSDLGVNARRVRGFLADLQNGAQPGS